MGQILLNIHLSSKIKGKILGENFLRLCQNKNIWKEIGSIWQM